MLYVIAYDIGTTGLKTCLFSIGETIEMIAGTYSDYDLYILENGGAEQDADQWWEAKCSTTKEIMSETDVTPDMIDGISFCSQMQGMVLVDREGRALRRPMSYMDQRAVREMKECQSHGIRIAGVNVFKLLKSLKITHAASTSVKDPVWKYKWVQKNEPEIFAKAHKWLDVKEYLIARCTDRFVMTRDSAYATFLYDTRKGREGWNESLCRMYGVDPEHLPEIIECTDVAGGLTEKAASELGLAPGTAVYGGGGDATLIGVGAGCTRTGATHIYSGTSGWVGTVIDRQKVDIVSMIAGIVGAQSGKYNYFAEMETAGKCFQWVKEHLALDEIGVYMQKTDVAESCESLYESKGAAGSRRGDIHTVAARQQMPVRRSERGGDVLQHQDRDGKDRDDKSSARGHMLSPAMDARVREQESADVRYAEVRRRRCAFGCDLSDARRYNRQDRRDRGKHERHGVDGSRSAGSRGKWCDRRF